MYKRQRIYWAKEVTFDYSTNHAVRVDYIRYKPVNNTVSGIEKGDFYCYEVKSSVEDFRSGHGLNFLGDYNYLVMPEKIYATISLEVPHYVGVYVLDGTELTCIKKAKRHDRSRPDVYKRQESTGEPARQYTHAIKRNEEGIRKWSI